MDLEKYRGQRRRCYVCGKLHDVDRVVDMTLRGGLPLDYDAFLCSHECWVDLAFRVKPAIDPNAAARSRRRAAGLA